jgi:hypothetical protein
MPRVVIEDFGADESARIYLAISLAEAQSVEAELDKHGVDYAVEVEAYRGGLLSLFTEYKGAAFYVHAAQADFCSEVLRAAGLKAGIIPKEFQ